MTGGDLELGDARPGDRARIAELTVAAYREYAEILGPFWEGYRASIVATVGEPSAAEQRVAMLAGALVGSVLLYPAGAVWVAGVDGERILDAPEARLLAVAPEARGRGVGEALMRECIHRARAAGAGSITLHTMPMMAAAMRLYERLGFARDPALDFDPVPGATVDGYRLLLPAA
jgi:ribosomal protein S18 acetylase RimI-like enzyme